MLIGRQTQLSTHRNLERVIQLFYRIEDQAFSEISDKRATEANFFNAPGICFFRYILSIKKQTVSRVAAQIKAFAIV